MPMKSECSRLIISVAFSPWVQSLASPVYNFCERLSQSYHGETYLSSNGSQYYVLANNNWFAAARNTPICIVTPTTPHELAVIVKALASVDVQFAVRSGGRSPAPKAANIRDGVLIDMSLFNEVSYDATTNLAVIGPGLTWGAVYKTLEAFNVTVVGGRVTDVGVGGLILGGGLPYLSDKYGLACDNVVSFQVVLGNGSIVTASASENSELHWALKGGANIFGIVTSFTLNAYPLPHVWGGIKGYSNNQLPALLDALGEYQDNYQEDSNSNIMIQSAITNDTVGTIINIVYLEPIQSPDAFSPFYNIPTTFDTTTIQSWYDFLNGQILSTLPRWDWRATSYGFKLL